MSIWPPEFTAKGKYVTVCMLGMQHEADLKDAAADGNLSDLWYTWVPTPDGMAAEIEKRLDQRQAGTMLPFAIIDNATGQAVGMTTFMNIDAVNKRVEIGSTWYRKSAQRGPLNTECKLLLLRHAFEELGCIAVEFRTHIINHQSRRAIERLGAKFDGVIRGHMVMANGTIRDTAVYSILPHEWPTVNAHLRHQLDKPR